MQGDSRICVEPYILVFSLYIASSFDNLKFIFIFKNEFTYMYLLCSFLQSRANHVARVLSIVENCSREEEELLTSFSPVFIYDFIQTMQCVEVLVRVLLANHRGIRRISGHYGTNLQ